MSDSCEAVCAPESTTSLVCCGVDSQSAAVTQGEAADVIVVKPPANEGNPSCSDFIVQFPVLSEAAYCIVCINNEEYPELSMVYSSEKGCRFCEGKSVKPPVQALEKLLHFTEKVSIQYTLFTENDTVVAVAQASLFLWNAQDRVVVCDIDGTITKSNTRGVLDTMITESYTYAHDGVCQFLTSLTREPEVRMLYLTSRPMSYATTTRRFLTGLRQEDTKLPAGPLFLHPGTLQQVLMSELVTKDVHQYKADTLLRQVVIPFGALDRENILLAGFGNTLADVVAYEMAGIPRRDIYMIDKQSRICCMDKHADIPVSDEVKMNSQGSLEVALEDSTRSTSTGSNDSLSSDAKQPSLRRSGSKLASLRRNGSKLASLRQSGKSMRSIHRSYSLLIGTSYSGYHDPDLLDHVRTKMFQG